MQPSCYMLWHCNFNCPLLRTLHFLTSTLWSEASYAWIIFHGLLLLKRIWCISKYLVLCFYNQLALERYWHILNCHKTPAKSMNFEDVYSIFNEFVGVWHKSWCRYWMESERVRGWWVPHIGALTVGLYYIPQDCRGHTHITHIHTTNFMWLYYLFMHGFFMACYYVLFVS